MRPTVEHPSKRFYHSLGENIALVIGLMFFVLIVIMASVLYKITF